MTTAKDGKVLVCQKPGEDDSLNNGGGYNCVVRDGGHIIEISVNAAMAHGLL